MSATFGDEATDGQRSKILLLGSILEPTEHPMTISPAVRSIVEEAGAVLCYLLRPLQKPADTVALLERVAALGTEPAKVIISVAGEGHPQETLAATIRTLEGLGFGVVGALPDLSPRADADSLAGWLLFTVWRKKREHRG